MEKGSHSCCKNSVDGTLAENGDSMAKSLTNLCELRRNAFSDCAEKVLPMVRSLAQGFSRSDASLGLSSLPDTILEDEERLRVELFRSQSIGKLIRIGPDRLVFAGVQLHQAAKLPAGYAYKGGVARLALEAIVGHLISGRRVRDFDVVRVGSAPRSKDDDVSQLFMGEDWLHGHGVEVVKDIDTYMSTRDLTVNECLLLGDELICSRRAFHDMRRLIVRPTDYYLQQGGQNIPSAVLLKAIRIYADLVSLGYQASIDGIPDMFDAKPFEFQIQLERALGIGRVAGRTFLQECSSRGVITAEQSEELLGKLLERGQKRAAIWSGRKVRFPAGKKHPNVAVG